MQGHAITSRVDRVDTLENGYKVVIDYKTGKPSLSGLCANPLRSPQLPLYAMALPFDVDAVAFYQIHRSAVQYVGLGNEASTESDSPSKIVEGFHLLKSPGALVKYQFPGTWEDTRQYWSQSINGMIANIATGHCPNEFNYPSQLAFYEHLDTILRPGEQQ